MTNAHRRGARGIQGITRPTQTHLATRIFCEDRGGGVLPPVECHDGCLGWVNVRHNDATMPQSYAGRLTSCDEQKLIRDGVGNGMALILLIGWRAVPAGTAQ